MQDARQQKRIKKNSKGRNRTICIDLLLFIGLFSSKLIDASCTGPAGKAVPAPGLRSNRRTTAVSRRYCAVASTSVTIVVDVLQHWCPFSEPAAVLDAGAGDLIAPVKDGGAQVRTEPRGVATKVCRPWSAGDDLRRRGVRLQGGVVVVISCGFRVRRKSKKTASLRPDVGILISHRIIASRGGVHIVARKGTDTSTQFSAPQSGSSPPARSEGFVARNRRTCRSPCLVGGNPGVGHEFSPK
jgi:hypothetical protein